MWKVLKNNSDIESKIVDSEFMHVKKTPLQLIWWRLNSTICKIFFAEHISKESEISDEMKEFMRKENEIVTKKMQDFLNTRTNT
jgi:hypothetical protein